MEKEKRKRFLQRVKNPKRVPSTLALSGKVLQVVLLVGSFTNFRMVTAWCMLHVAALQTASNSIPNTELRLSHHHSALLVTYF